MNERFQGERWSLFVVFDSYDIQASDTREMLNVLGEKAALESHILNTFGGLPEEYAEIVRHHNDGRMEISSGQVEYLAQIMEWVTYHTIPQEMKLVRNEDR
jgi:hypothetical protein